MFKFLKEKLKDAVASFTEKVEEEGKIVEEIVEKPAKKEKIAEKPAKEKPAKTVQKKEKKTAPKKEPAEKATAKTSNEEAITLEETEVYVEEEPVEDVKPGFFKRLFGKKEEVPQENATVQELEEAKEIIQEAEEPLVKEEAEEVEEKDRESEDEELEEESAEELEEEDEEPEEGELEEPEEELDETGSEETLEQESEKTEEKGFFERFTQKIVAKEIDEAQFEELFWELEVGLLENNVAVEVIEKIKHDLKKSLVGKPIKRTQIMETIGSTLKTSIEGLFTGTSINFLEQVKTKKPYIVCFVGINGSGKTTTIAKVAKLLQNEGLSVVLAAADTFRAAAIDQLQTHADNLNVKLIKHDYGSDPAAVAYDAVKHALSKNVDVVLIDTAGRMHSNINLVDEMKKIIRVAKPDLKIFVGESITGNDCVEQAKQFDTAITLDGIILSKADIDEKGGAALSVSYVTGKPILFIGTGQEYKDIKKFDKNLVLDNLGL